MKKHFVTSVLFLSLASTAVFAAQTLTGTVTDTMCGKKHMMPGKSNAECTRECAKSGSKYALLVGEKVYTLSGDAKQLGALAGQKVTVSGDVSGTSVAVKSIAAAK